MLDNNKYQALDLLELDEKPLKKYQNKPLTSIVLLMLLGIVLLFTNGWILGVCIFVACGFAVFFVPNKKVLDLYQDKAIIYHKDDNNLVEVVDFADVKEWRIQPAKTAGSVVLFILNDDEFAHVELFQGTSVFRTLDKIMPEKETEAIRKDSMKGMKTPLSMLKRKKD